MYPRLKKAFDFIEFFFHKSFYHPLFNILFGVVSLFSIISSVLAFVFANNLYENVVKDYLGNKFLFVFFFIFPIIVIYIILILILRIWTHRLLKVEGSKVRARIMVFFFYLGAAILTVFLLLSYFITTQFFVYYETNYLDIKKYNTENNEIELEIFYQQEKIKKQIEEMVKKNQIIIDENKVIDFIITYDISKQPFFKAKKNHILDIPLSIQFPFLDLIEKGDFFSSYLEKYGLIYTIYRKKISFEIEHYIVAFHYLPFNVVDNLSKNQFLKTRISRFELLRQPIRVSIFSSIFYLYFVSFAIGLIYFYYKANSFTLSIILLNRAAKKITENNFNIEIPPKKHQDEIFELIVSFQIMAKNLKDNQFKLKRLSQIEAWQEVIERISHEIKNPLTPINLAVDQIKNTIVKENFEIYCGLNEKFNLVQQEIDRIRKLLKEMNLFHHKPNLQLKSTNIKALIENFSSFLEIYSGIKYEFVFENKTTTLYIDQEKIYQVIINILQNAIESLEEVENNNLERKITITVYEKRDKSFNLEKSQNHLCIAISNNGLIISAKEKEKIFKPYITFKKKGTGLGLSICEQIIYAHQGRIHLDSTEALTTFTIALPILNKVESGKNQNLSDDIKH